ATSSRCSPKTSRARTTRCGRSRSTSSAGRSWSTWPSSLHAVAITPPPQAKVTVGPSVAVDVTSSGATDTSWQAATSATSHEQFAEERIRWRYGAIGLAAVAVVLAVIGVIGATAGLLVFAGLVLAAGAACEGVYRWRAVQHTTEVNERLSVVQQRVDAAAGKQAAAEEAARAADTRGEHPARRHPPVGRGAGGVRCLAARRRRARRRRCPRRRPRRS
ncbi:MAG: hypothetical protein WKF58_12985, partial [Ilumatobacteraceae bacterium]